MKKLLSMVFIVLMACLACFTALAEEPCDHVWTQTLEPTCATPGKRGCEKCGIVETISALGHDWAQTKSPTCTESGKRGCSRCGAVETISALGHTEQVLPGKAATCTQAGLTEGKKCSVCGEVLAAQTEIPAKGHTVQTLPGKAATCTQAGLTEGKECSACGEVLAAQTEIPAKGHTVQTLPGKAATCTQAGLTEGKKCSACGEVLAAQTQIPAKGHTFLKTVHKATTVSQGYDELYCSTCGYTLRTNYTPIRTPAVSTAQKEEISAENLGDIVFDENGEAEAYVLMLEDGLLTVAPDEPQSAALRKLWLNFDWLGEMLEQSVTEVRFAVSGAELVLPVEALLSETTQVIRDDMEAQAYVVTLDPAAKTEDGEPGCLVQVEMVSEDLQTDVTEFIAGLTLIRADGQTPVTAGGVYAAQGE